MKYWNATEMKYWNDTEMKYWNATEMKYWNATEMKYSETKPIAGSNSPSIQHEMASNPGLGVERPTTKYVRHGRASFTASITFLYIFHTGVLVVHTNKPTII